MSTEQNGSRKSATLVQIGNGNSIDHVQDGNELFETDLYINDVPIIDMKSETSGAEPCYISRAISIPSITISTDGRESESPSMVIMPQ